MAAEISPTTVLSLINAERAKLSLQPLTSNSQLTDAAEKKALSIIEQATFAHSIQGQSFTEWVRDAGYEYTITGENLGINFSDTLTLMNAWLASAAHKKNIVYPDFQEVGIAAVRGEWMGQPTTIVVTIFASPAPTNQEQVIPTSLKTVPPLLITSNLHERYLTGSVLDTADTASLSTLPVTPPILTTPVSLHTKTAMKDYLFIAASSTAGAMAFVLLIGTLTYLVRDFLGFRQRLSLLS